MKLLSTTKRYRTGRIAYEIIKDDSIDNYRYVPAVLLKGWYADYAEGSGQNEDANLLCLNAMDGSVIPLGQ